MKLLVAIIKPFKFQSMDQVDCGIEAYPEFTRTVI